MNMNMNRAKVMKLIKNTHYRKIRNAKWKYELLLDLGFKVDLGYLNFTHQFFSYENGALIVRRGYSWDGASGPAIDTDTVLRASCGHDAVCQADDLGLIKSAYQRKNGDRMFRGYCLEDGMHEFRAWYMYKSVRAWSRLTRLSNKYD